MLILLLASLTALAAPDKKASPTSQSDEASARASRLVTIEGEDPPFADIIKSGAITPGERFSKGPVPGSRVRVNHELLEKQVGKPDPIPQQIGIHTEARGAIKREDFSKWTRWYQEDGNVQVFRLFKGEQNIRGGIGQKGSQGRIEAFTRSLEAGPDNWREWEGTYTIIKPVGANIFQLFHNGEDKNGRTILWPFHIRMSGEGDIYFHRRRPVAGMATEIVLGKNMAGKSLSVKVRANGTDYEVYQKRPLDKGPWKPVTKGSYIPAKDNKISFRWGMYAGSRKGQSIPNDALILVTGVSVR